MDPNGHAPDTVRRAQAFIRAHARDDVGLAEIAAAAGVTPRVLQYVFARQGSTPMRCLRQVRLAGAHQDLLAARADPESAVTVTAVAGRWRFSNPGRFAAAYQRLYGQLPSRTLRS